MTEGIFACNVRHGLFWSSTVTVWRVFKTFKSIRLEKVVITFYTSSPESVNTRPHGASAVKLGVIITLLCCSVLFWEKWTSFRTGTLLERYDCYKAKVKSCVSKLLNNGKIGFNNHVSKLICLSWPSKDWNKSRRMNHKINHEFGLWRGIKN